ncbi:isocyanide synthase family protein [Aquimarina sp. Aq78]|uniref:isocyanide synthase family protein n=1 Tax=Aquimarina sp. Aq78 TaxID=1191889 RepID=UPI000D10827B|nr:isocyanide synthase family protein [Aquimarina sp. Aq78]
MNLSQNDSVVSIKKEQSSLAKKIFNVIMNYSHLKVFDIEIIFDDPDVDVAVRNHLKKINSFIHKNEPIRLILPAFPAKSPNREKTLGIKPDLGEFLGLKRLNKICTQIQQIYTPGAKVVICSDGRVFSDIVQVNDDDVTTYSEALNDMIKRENINYLETFNLDNVFPELSYDEMRYELSNNYGESIEEVKYNVKNQESEKNLFNGLHKFVYEDMSVLNRELSKNQLKKQSKEIAYQVIQRSHSWSDLVAKFFPECIRISIHPQKLNTGKIGIQLVKCNHNWGTPWHNVVLLDEEGYKLVKNKEAKEMGAELISSQKGYSFYSMV